MSILSSDRFYLGGICVELSEYTEYVELFFAPSMFGNSYSTTSNSITITNGYNTTGYVVSLGGTYTSDQRLCGYKFYLINKYGSIFLKAKKLFISQQGLIAGANSFLEASNYIQEVPCNPSDICNEMSSPEMLLKIQEKLISLAARYGLFVSEQFRDITFQYAGIDKSTSIVCLDWLSYPLVREIDSITFTKNLLPTERNVINPTLEPLNFKELVEHYYGTSTPKLLEEVWKVVAVENQTASTNTQKVQDRSTNNVILEACDLFLPSALSHAGDKSLQSLAFTLGPAIHSIFGFDYLYQALPLLAKRDSIKPREINDIRWFKEKINFLSKFLSPQKIIKLMPELVDFNAIHLLDDTIKMLKDYDSVDKIPNALKNQYPSGLLIDFKFKTIKEMHDKISTQYTIIETEGYKKEIPYHNLYLKLDGKEKEKLKLVVPTNTTYLSLWGKLLNICIASYGDRAAKGETLLLGVEEEGSIKYCIEFDSYRTNEGVRLPRTFESTRVNPEDQTLQRILAPSFYQFKGRGNGAPTDEDKEVVQNMVTDWMQENSEELKKCADSTKIETVQINTEGLNIYGNVPVNVGPINFMGGANGV